VSDHKLGPRQQKDAKRHADYVWLWSMDLRKAIEANNVETAEQLVETMTESLDHLGKTLKRARS
jgi:hypothetical protein